MKKETESITVTTSTRPDKQSPKNIQFM